MIFHIVAPVIWLSPQDPSIAPSVNVALRGAYVKVNFLMEIVVMNDVCFTKVWGVKMELSIGKLKKAVILNDQELYPLVAIT